MGREATGRGAGDAAAFLDTVEPARRRGEAWALDALFRAATGFAPVLWPSGIVGYGRYAYTYPSGRSGVWFATGFAPRKAAISIHILPGYADFGGLLERLGPHRTGASCLYVTRLEQVDMTVLKEIVVAGLRNLATHWPVEPT